jgi:hypothetical protein
MISRKIIAGFFLFLTVVLMSCIFPAKATASDSGYNWSIMPLPAFTVSPETGIGLGVAALYSGVPEALSLTAKPDTAVFSVLYTQKRQLQFDLVVEKYFGGSEWFFNAEPIFNKYSSFFWGLGPDTTVYDSENFSYIEGGITVSLLKEIAPRIYIGLYYKFLAYDIIARETGGLIASGLIPGSGGGAVSSPGFRFLWEARDRRYSPGSGFFLDLKADLSAKALGASSNSYMFDADYRGYYTVFRENILAFNIVAKFYGIGTPLRAIPRLGGLYLMRGYYEGRYTDYDYITGQVEYRFPIFWTFRGAVFVCLGQVAPRIDYFKTDGIKISYGFGIHWKPFDFMDSPLRFDLAFSGGDPQLYLDLMEAF